MAYPLDALDPTSTTPSLKSRQKLPSFQLAKSVSFFEAGVCDRRVIVVVKKKKGVDSVFTALEPVCGDLRDSRNAKYLNTKSGLLSRAPSWFKSYRVSIAISICYNDDWHGVLGLLYWCWIVSNSYSQQTTCHCMWKRIWNHQLGYFKESSTTWFRRSWFPICAKASRSTYTTWHVPMSKQLSPLLQWVCFSCWYERKVYSWPTQVRLQYHLDG